MQPSKGRVDAGMRLGAFDRWVLRGWYALTALALSAALLGPLIAWVNEREQARWMRSLRLPEMPRPWILETRGVVEVWVGLDRIVLSEAPRHSSEKRGWPRFWEGVTQRLHLAPRRRQRTLARLNNARVNPEQTAAVQGVIQQTFGVPYHSPYGLENPLGLQWRVDGRVPMASLLLLLGNGIHALTVEPHPFFFHADNDRSLILLYTGYRACQGVSTQLTITPTTYRINAEVIPREGPDRERSALRRILRSHPEASMPSGREPSWIEYDRWGQAIYPGLHAGNDRGSIRLTSQSVTYRDVVETIAAVRYDDEHRPLFPWFCVEDGAARP